MARATTSKLSPGEHTAERSNPSPQADGGFRLTFTLIFRDGRRTRPSVYGATRGEVRRKAKRKADALLRTNGSTWNFSDSFPKYIQEVTRPALEKAKLSEMTRERYDAGLRFLLGDCQKCKKQGVRHKHGLNNHTLGSGTTPRALEALFTEIAERHGPSTAKSSRTVWNKYIAKRLILDNIMSSNPMMGQRLSEVTGVERPPRTRGGLALARQEYDLVLEWLLEADPTHWLVSHKKYGWIWRPDVQIATFLTGIDITLLQMTTGLRQSEARLLTWSMAHVSAEGVMSIDVPEEVAKGGIPRVVLVLDHRVADRLLVRREEQNGEGFIIGAPMDRMKVWHRASCIEACRKLYVRMAKETKIDLFQVQRSHLWRTTLRSFYAGKVPEAVLNSQFGHSSEVAKLYYTDASDLSGLASAANLTFRG